MSSYNLLSVLKLVIWGFLGSILHDIISYFSTRFRPARDSIIQSDWSNRKHCETRPQFSSNNLKLTLENGSSCPYEYILSVYGRNHFSKFVDTLRPDLSSQDPSLYGLVLEVMDAIHFGAILVDDVADKSLLRKGKSAAHCIFGPSETINRAYLRIMEVIGKCTQERPSLVPFVLDNLAQIHKGRLSSPLWKLQRRC